MIILQNRFLQASFKARESSSSLRMAWRCTGKSNAELVSNLAASGLIKNERVMRAMSGVGRSSLVEGSLEQQMDFIRPGESAL